MIIWFTYFNYEAFIMRFVVTFLALAMTISTAHAATLTTLINFNVANGRSPASNLIADASGNLFGTTLSGGAFDNGTIFKLDATGNLTTLFSFNGENGARPSGNLIADASGNLLGTTEDGGAFDNGTIFRLNPAGALTTLFSFNGSNGSDPRGGLIADASGNLFGTTARGGAFGNDFGFGDGTVFRLDRTGVLTTLINFNGENGASPSGGLIVDASGNLFGTTDGGGAFGNRFLGGTVFKLDTAGMLTTLVSFIGENGFIPRGSLITDASGNLFGTTQSGGLGGRGTIFRLDTSGALTTLFSFNGLDGSTPVASLIADASGNLFGTTQRDGESADAGTVFRLDRSGVLTTLVSFNGLDGRFPSGSLIADASGNLFGTALEGGAFSSGTVFRISDANFNVVPEPATWAMMLFGFGLVGATLRARQFRTPTAKA
jgi:uncharacterized repeat protein (TIGR03803 family)